MSAMRGSPLPRPRLPQAHDSRSGGWNDYQDPVRGWEALRHSIRGDLAKDIDRLMSLYSPDIVYFDLVPPLQYVGADALRERFLDWFDSFEGPIGQEITDLNVVESGRCRARTHAHPGRRNPEERTRGRFLGPCDRRLPAVGRRVADHA